MKLVRERLTALLLILNLLLTISVLSSRGVGTTSGITSGPIQAPIRDNGEGQNFKDEVMSLSGHMRFLPRSAAPSNPALSSGVNIYTKGSSIIFQYNDGGTVRYNSLDMSGTGVTWSQSTTAP